MTKQQRAAELVERLHKAYKINNPEFDFHVTQLLSGDNNQEMRREVIQQATGQKLPLSKCGVFAVADSLKTKFDQLSLF